MQSKNGQKINGDKMDEKQYDEILEKIRDRFWEMSKSERRNYIEKLVNKETKGDEEELKELFAIGKKKNDIPKNLEYSYDNLIEAIMNATNILGGFVPES